MKYFIVFQEKKGEKHLWAPTQNTKSFFHKNILDVRKEDIIFISHGAKIVAYSKAITNPYENYNENTIWDPNGHRVDIEVINLEYSFKMKNYKETVLEYKSKVEKYFPYNVDGNGNQGYLFKITEDFANYIISLIEKNGNKKVEIYSNREEIEEIEQLLEDKKLIGEEKEVVIKARVNQGIFRKQLLNSECKCKLCGLSNEKLLIASHIKPWSESDKNEKLHIHNGLLFCPHHDKLFDKFLISFEDDGKIIISDELSQEDRMLLNIRDNMKVKISDENKKYLKWHRNEFFARMSKEYK
ncbi:HNH endonuclease [Sebaldella termitidis]|uniref:HNH endonuclease n=1 Tax=Sebaldella termitidis TaxID=826 RepID=UPI003EC147E6